MGYESKVFIVNKFVCAETIASIDMAKMPFDFVKLFDKEIDYEVYIGRNERTKTDCYGDTMTYTDCQTIINYLENLIASGETYRRLSMLLGLLKGINEGQWDDIQIVHYGY